MKNALPWLYVGSSIAAIFLMGMMAADCGNTSKLDPPAKHLATEFTGMIPEAVIGKCSRWTDDAVLCRGVSGQALIWCEAPAHGKPHCEVAADWSPKQEPPAK